MSRPNILYLNSHDTGRYIQPYGYPVDTPNLLKLAETGTMFRQAYCMGPTCSPSRAALLTGQCPHSAGMMGLTHRGWALQNPKQHWVHTLNDAGYTSHFAGVQHVASDVSTLGYHEVLEPSRDQEVYTAKALEFLKSKPEEPFYLEVGYFLTHRAFSEPEENPAFVRPPAIFPDTPETRKDFAAYRTEAKKLDNYYGQILNALEDAGLADNTLVICTTDHGIAFPGMKCNLTNHGTGVLLLMRGPGGFEGGRAIDGLTSHIDVFPTLCELLEIDKPAWLQGTSLMPLVRGEAEEVNEAVFGEVTYHACYQPMRSVRTRRYNYIRRFYDRREPMQPNVDDSPSKTFWQEHGWPSRTDAREELYDLLFDPQERCNRAGDPDYGLILGQMRNRLEGWMCDTDDPLLRGHVPVADDGLVNLPDQPAAQHGNAISGKAWNEIMLSEGV